jgi:hypothetical protein
VTAAGTSLTTSLGVSGGYRIRFTAIRLVDEHNATLHGRGLVPDRLVHPTLAGIRAGRDEILEAGLAEAQRLAGALRDPGPGRVTP